MGGQTPGAVNQGKAEKMDDPPAPGEKLPAGSHGLSFLGPKILRYCAIQDKSDN
jgi:hypothetical protein